MGRSDWSLQVQFRKLRKTEDILFRTPHNFAYGSHLVALTQTGSKLPRSQFLPKRFMFPYVYQTFHLLWPITISLFVSGPKSKKNQFSPISVAAPKKLPTASSISMPPTFHIASLNCYTPKFSGGPKSRPGVIVLASISDVFRCFFTK